MIIRKPIRHQNEQQECVRQTCDRQNGNDGQQTDKCNCILKRNRKGGREEETQQKTVFLFNLVVTIDSETVCFLPC